MPQPLSTTKVNFDPQVKALRELLTQQTDPQKQKEIQDLLDQRVAELLNQGV